MIPLLGFNSAGICRTGLKLNHFEPVPALEWSLDSNSAQKSFLVFQVRSRKLPKAPIRRFSSTPLSSLCLEIKYVRSFFAEFGFWKRNSIPAAEAKKNDFCCSKKKFPILFFVSSSRYHNSLFEFIHDFASPALRSLSSPTLPPVTMTAPTRFLCLSTSLSSTVLFLCFSSCYIECVLLPFLLQNLQPFSFDE